MRCQHLIQQGNDRREWYLNFQQQPFSALQKVEKKAQALNRFAIGALVAGVGLNRDLLRVL